jgi:hypothetical protein
MLRFPFRNSSGKVVAASPSRRGVLKIACLAVTGGVGGALWASSASAGWGACSKCACAGFKADYRNDRVCETCGHGYGDHW